MNRMAACLIAGMLWAARPGPQAAPSNPSVAASVNSERIESGVVHTPSGRDQPYRIRLLPVSSFPDLPPAVAAELRRLGCMIPQSFEARGPENVIHGDFRAAGSDDWAALCSVNGSTTLYVFFSGQFASPHPLRTQADTVWLGAEPGSAIYGSAWGIAVRPLAELEDSPRLLHPTGMDHGAIDDARLEKSVTIRYDDHGKWHVLNPDDQTDE